MIEHCYAEATKAGTVQVVLVQENGDSSSVEITAVDADLLIAQLSAILAKARG